MEIPAPFDLNNAIRSWRENLATSPAFRAENLDELEAHLRDSVSALVAKGLSDEEAWWVAAQRVGKADSLRDEFSKANVERVWLDRAVWILAGFLLISWLKSVASNFSMLLVAAGGMFQVPPHARGLLMALAHTAALMGMLVFAWKFVTRSPNQMTRISVWCRKHPLGIGLGVLLIVMLRFGVSPATLILAHRSMSPADLQVFLQWYSIVLVPFDLFWPALLAWLLWRRARTKEFAG